RDPTPTGTRRGGRGAHRTRRQGGGADMRYHTQTVEPLHAKLFGRLHAAYYDRFHFQKDYRSEVDQIVTVLAEHGPAASVVDLGCGTGRHLEPLAEAGLEVTGVDRSPAMVDRARNL